MMVTHRVQLSNVGWSALPKGTWQEIGEYEPGLRHLDTASRPESIKVLVLVIHSHFILSIASQHWIHSDVFSNE